MISYIIVALGGAIGSILRFLSSNFISEFSNISKFPIGTLFVNIIGSFIIGLLFGYSEKVSILNENLKLFFITGLLGGYTTFSAFSIETLLLIKTGQIYYAIFYTSISIILGISCAYLGYKIF